MRANSEGERRGIPKPRLARLGRQSNPLNFKPEEGNQRRLHRLGIV
jgi:hypothetical protein